MLQHHNHQHQTIMAIIEIPHKSDPPTNTTTRSNSLPGNTAHAALDTAKANAAFSASETVAGLEATNVNDVKSAASTATTTMPTQKKGADKKQGHNPKGDNTTKTCHLLPEKKTPRRTRCLQQTQLQTSVRLVP
jgi:hypothetical protein